MQKVTVTTLSTHIDDQGITRRTGDEYGTSKNYAELRKGNGLVEFDGEGKKPEGQPLIHAGTKADTGLTSTAIMNQPEGQEGNLIPVGKPELAARKAADKAHSEVKAAANKTTLKHAAKKTIPATVIKEKKEGGFPAKPFDPDIEADLIKGTIDIKN